MMNKIKLFACDIDGTLTNGYIYQLEDGQEMKKFSCKDGAGFYILKEFFPYIKIAFLTSEKAGINLKRFEKLNRLGIIDDFVDNVYLKSKYNTIKDLCNKYKITLNEVAYIGDDLNDFDILFKLKYKACPSDANKIIKKIKGIKIMKNKGGDGAVREYIDYLREKKLLYKEG